MVKKKTYIWFNQEITFYNDIQRMMREQKAEGNTLFAITSKNQPSNSSDVLFPFDKVPNKLLFIDESRMFYKKCCRENIDVLFDFLEKLISMFNIEYIEIFVVEGYDDIFQRKVCNIDEVKRDLLYQIEERVSIDSSIYYVR